MIKKIVLFFYLIFAALFAAACGKTTQASVNDNTVDAIHTAIMITLTSQAGIVTATMPATVTTAPTATPEAEPSETTEPPASNSPPASVSYSSTSGCDYGAFISETIPDGTIIAPGESFTKAWYLENTGTCVWSSDYRIEFVSGDEMDGSDTEIGTSVSPGEQVQTAVLLVAPDSEGTYTGYWRMANDDGTQYGVSLWVQIVVSEDSNTITPTPTSTVYTSTPTSTSISTAISTPICTATSTATAVIPPSSTPQPTSIPTDTPQFEFIAISYKHSSCSRQCRYINHTMIARLLFSHLSLTGWR